MSEPVSEYFDVLKLPSHVFPGPLIYALPLKLNLYFNLIEFEIDFHTSAPPKFQIFERSKSPPSQNFNFIKFSNFFSLSKNKLNFNTQPFYNGLFGGKTIVVQFKVLKSTLWPQPWNYGRDGFTGPVSKFHRILKVLGQSQQALIYTYFMPESNAESKSRAGIRGFLGRSRKYRTIQFWTLGFDPWSRGPQSDSES